MTIFGTSQSTFGGSQNAFGASTSVSNNTLTSAQKTAEVQSPPSDTVSCLRFSPATVQTTFLAATSWDKRVRIWEVQGNGITTAKAEQMHQGPALCACWSTVC